MNIQYDNRFNGAHVVVRPDYQGSYVLTPPSVVGAGDHYVVNSGTAFTCTGYYTETTGLPTFVYMQTTSGVWLLLGNITSGESDFQITQSSNKLQYSSAQAQSYVDRLIENNKQIVSCNLLCARFAYKLSQQEKRTLYDLQIRLQERNQRLISDGLVSGITTSTPAGYSQLQSYLQQFMQTGGVGLVISTTTAIVISCVVIASLSTAAYFAYKFLFEESAKDVKYSKQLTETLLAKLTPDEYDQLMRETQGIVTKAKIKQMVSSTSGLLKWALVGTAAYMLYTNLFKKGKDK